MYVSLNDLALIIFLIVAVISGAYFIAVCRRALCLMGQADKLFKANEEAINKTIALLPAALVSINELSDKLNAVTGQTEEVLTAIGENVIDKVADLSDGLASFNTYINLFIELIKAVFSRDK